MPHGVYKKEWSSTANIPTGSAAYSRPLTVTSIDAGLYFTETESDDPAHADATASSDPDAASTPTPDADTNAHMSTPSDAAMAWQGEDGQPTAL